MSAAKQEQPWASALGNQSTYTAAAPQGRRTAWPEWRIQGLTDLYAEAHPAIFDAIRKRRCYATTGEPIQIDFRVNGHFMGAEIEAASGPVIEARVTGTSNLTAVEIVKFTTGDSIPFPVVYKAPIDGPRAKIWWRDPNFTRNSLYYLRLMQQLSPALATRSRGQPDSRFPARWPGLRRCGYGRRVNDVA